MVDNSGNIAHQPAAPAADSTTRILEAAKLQSLERPVDYLLLASELHIPPSHSLALAATYYQIYMQYAAEGEQASGLPVPQIVNLAELANAASVIEGRAVRTTEVLDNAVSYIRQVLIRGGMECRPAYIAWNLAPVLGIDMADTRQYRYFVRKIIDNYRRVVHEESEGPKPTRRSQIAAAVLAIGPRILSMTLEDATIELNKGYTYIRGPVVPAEVSIARRRLIPRLRPPDDTES